MKNLLTALFLFLCLSSIGQESSAEIEKFRGKKFYFYWGYNRSFYAKSDIKLISDNYNITLKEVEAHDLPTQVSATYINPLRITIPQFNLRLGYNFYKEYFISVGWDHMKYKSKNGSKAILDGNIDVGQSAIYSGKYSNQAVVMNDDELVRMEHSDGFNVVNINIERPFSFWKNKNGNIELFAITGGGIGLAIPWTNSKIFGVRNDDRVHFSGMGGQLYLAPEIEYQQRLFFRFTTQVGFTRLWDIAIVPKGDKSAHAEQTIKYLELSGVLGYRF